MIYKIYKQNFNKISLFFSSK